MTALNIAAQINNIGVGYLEHGDLPRALELFREALQHTMDGLDAPTTPSALLTVRTGTANLWDSQQINPTMLGLTPKRDGSTTDCTAINQQENASVSFVHTCAIALDSAPRAYSDNPMANTTITSAIIIFNLACVYHVRGLEGGDACQLNFRKAESLYDKCHRLLLDLGALSTATGNTVVDFLTMAHLNNLAQLNFERTNFRCSTALYAKLTRFINTVHPHMYDNPRASYLLDHHKQNFLLNAIILRFPPVASAA